MSVESNATYIPTMDEFLGHWELCNTALGANPLLVTRPGKAATTRAVFDTLRTSLITSQNAVQAKLNLRQIARGDINLKKADLLITMNAFIAKVEARYQGTKFYNAKPGVPGINEGQESFSNPLVDAMTLWQNMNDGTAPAGVTLPLTVGAGVGQSDFASAIAALQVSYKDERAAMKGVDLARAERNLIQLDAYEIMKAYRIACPSECSAFPALVSTMPKLTPEAGHTPDPVNASADYVAPSTSHVVFTASADPDLAYYDLEGTNGEDWEKDDAVHLGRVYPGAANEFTVQFGLTQPDTAVALKVFVVLNTGNRSGSATMVVRRPAA